MTLTQVALGNGHCCVFSVTSALIVLLAAGLAAQAAQFLTNAGLITVLDRPLWNTSAFLREDSLVGRVLHALVGYTDRPTALQGLVYLATIAVMIGLMQWSAADKRRAVRAA